MLVEIVIELLVHETVDDTLDVGVAEFHLGLTFELRVRDLDRNDCAQTLSYIGVETLLEIIRLEESLSVLVLAYKLLQMNLELVLEAGDKTACKTDEVFSAFTGVDVVCKGVEILVEPVVVLECEFHDCSTVVIGSFSGVVDRLCSLRDYLLVLIDIGDEVLDSSIEMEDLLLRIIIPVVNGSDGYSLVKEGKLPESLAQYSEAEVVGLHDGCVGMELDCGSYLFS